MKKFIFIIFLFLFLTVQAKAEDSSTGSATVTPQSVGRDLLDKLKQIEIFKEKIATKVAQKRKADKGAFQGLIKSVTDNNLTVTSDNVDKKLTFGDDTVFYDLTKNQRKSADSSALKTGTLITAFGYNNDNKDLLLSKYIYLDNPPPLRIQGKIADVNKKDFTLTVKAKDGDRLIDIEKSTRSSVFVKGKGAVKTGFSGFQIGSLVFISGVKNEKEENRYTANNIIIIETANISPVIITVSPTLTPAKSKTSK